MDFVNINYNITSVMHTDKKRQNNQETKKTEQNSQNNGQFIRQSSIYSRHDDICFLDQADHQNSDN